MSEASNREEQKEELEALGAIFGSDDEAEAPLSYQVHRLSSPKFWLWRKEIRRRLMKLG